MEKEVEEYKKFRPGDPAMKTKAMLTLAYTHTPPPPPPLLPHVFGMQVGSVIQFGV